MCLQCPVSLTCVACKLLEHIVCSNIMAHLDEHKLLADTQHAIRKLHSCETQLTTVINNWAKVDCYIPKTMCCRNQHSMAFRYPLQVKMHIYISSKRGPVIDQKYACLINFPSRHSFNRVMLYTLCKLILSLCFTTCQFMTSSFYVLDDVI